MNCLGDHPRCLMPLNWNTNHVDINATHVGTFYLPNGLYKNQDGPNIL